jgi:hypothetical protein
MKAMFEGKEIDVEVNEDFMKNLAHEPMFNTELDRMRVKGEDAVRTTLTGEHQTAIDALTATHNGVVSAHNTALEDAKKVQSGEKDEQIEGLKNQIQTITDSFTTSEANRVQSEKDSAKSSVEGKLIIALDGVSDPYNKTNITRDAMDKFDADTGQFKLSTGVMGGIVEVVAEMMAVHPDKFLSKQPPGNNVNGGGNNTIVPNKPYAEMNVAEKAAYLEQKNKG